MKITEVGKDYVILNCLKDIEKFKDRINDKIHLIELDFKDPTESILKQVINNFPKTRRFIISNFIKFYNIQFKKYLDKKFYVRNLEGDNLLIFFKRNNKILLDLVALTELERMLVFNDLALVLDYIEVINIDKKNFDKHYKILKRWNGNVIIQ